MSRQQTIEKAARAVGQARVPFFGWGSLNDATQSECRVAASAVLDAILPQVTTVEELAVLPAETLLLGESGRTFRRMQSGWWWDDTGRCALDQVAGYAPLTVVWTPGGAA